MTRRPHGLAILLAVAALAASASGCGSSAGVHSHPLAPPPSTPAWLTAAAADAAARLGDPNAKIVSVSLGARPIVVLGGTFRCNLCSRPGNSTPVQTGTYAGIRFDAATEQGTDFGLAGSEQQVLSSLCGGAAC